MRVVTVIESVHTNIQGGLLIHRKSLYIDLICGLRYHTNCRHQACCIDRIRSTISQISVSSNQFEPVHLVESTVSIYLTSVMLKNFTRYLPMNENDWEVLNVNSIASERNAFRFMHDQQERVLMLGGLVANTR